MPDAVELSPDDAKLVTLARSARARNNATEGAAVRDDSGRTYVGTSVELASLTLSALQAAVVIAVASGAESLEAAAIVGAQATARTEDLAVVADLSPSAPIMLAGLDGAVHRVIGPN
jgi:cytidine deaminase